METYELLFWLVVFVYSIMLFIFFLVAFIAHTSGEARMYVEPFKCRPEYRKWVNFVRWSWRILFIPFTYIMILGEIFKETCAKMSILYDKNNKGCR